MLSEPGSAPDAVEESSQGLGPAALDGDEANGGFELGRHGDLL